MSIDRAPSGKWRARYRDHAGRQRSRSFDRKGDARRFLDAIAARKATGEWLDPELRKTTIGELAAALLNSKSDHNTRRWYEQMVRHVNERWGGVPVGAINYLDVQGWINAMTVERGPDTVRGSYLALHETVKMALRSRIIGYDPCLGVKLPPTERREMLFLSAPQVSLLAETMEGSWPGHGWGVLVRFAAYSGCRAGEIGGLQRKHVDLARNRVQIAVARKTYGIDGQTKTRRIRWVVLPRQLCGELADHLGKRSDGPQERVWTGNRGGPLNHHWFYESRFKPTVEHLTGSRELPTIQRLSTSGSKKFLTLRFHDLRHTCVALLIAEGAQQYEIMEHLGHTTIKTTIDTYGHLFGRVHDRIRGALEAIWEQADTDVPVSHFTGSQVPLVSGRERLPKGPVTRP